MARGRPAVARLVLPPQGRSLASLHGSLCSGGRQFHAAPSISRFHQFVFSLSSSSANSQTLFLHSLFLTCGRGGWSWICQGSSPMAFPLCHKSGNCCIHLMCLRLWCFGFGCAENIHFYVGRPSDLDHAPPGGTVPLLAPDSARRACFSPEVLWQVRLSQPDAPPRT